MDPDRVQKTLYVGSRFATSVVMTLLGWYTFRHPELHDMPESDLRSSILADAIGSALFAIAYVTMLAVPSLSYYPMFLLLLTGPLHILAAAVPTVLARTGHRGRERPHLHSRQIPAITVPPPTTICSQCVHRGPGNTTVAPGADSDPVPHHGDQRAQRRAADGSSRSRRETVQQLPVGSLAARRLSLASRVSIRLPERHEYCG